jgi:topoisomerase-4 subunit B
LGEISPDEFGHFIGEEMRLEPVILTKETSLKGLLEFYMGKNTMKRQEFIIDNLKIEKDLVEEVEKIVETVAESEKVIV